MSYRKVPRKAIRYTAANPPKAAPVQQDAGAGLADLSYRDLQERAKLLGISGKQTAEALIQQIEEAEKR